MKTKRRPRRRRRTKRDTALFGDIIMANAYGAMRDESHALIQRWVEETLKDPELRDKIDRFAREFIKGIAARL